MGQVTTQELIAAGENLYVEFKSDANDDALVKAVACLANAEGGVLLIGVSDRGEVVGARPRHGDITDPHRVAAVIQSRTVPALGVEVSLVDMGGQSIIRIEIPRADPGPVGTSDGVFTKRVIDTTGKPQCLPMTAPEIVSMGMVMRGQDYAAAVAKGATVEDLDEAEFDRFRRMCTSTGDPLATVSNADILVALGLVPRHDPISLGAVLLFGRSVSVERWIPTAEFLFQDDRSSEDMINIRMVTPLLRATEELVGLVNARNSVTELMAGLLRIEIPLIPAVTRREAIANAVVHRDYTSLGPTALRITGNQFVVSNAGGFPPGVTISNILDESRPRSPILCDAFRRAGLVERRGKGVNQMFEQQLRAGRAEPDFSRSTSASVVVSVALGSADLDLVRFILTWENEHTQSLTLDEIRVVHEVKAFGSTTTSEIVESLHLLPTTARVIATRLVELGILEARGSGRSRKYHLTARFYDLAQDRSAYVRVKGVDSLQQERMILDYVRAYGSITRRQAAELCQTSPTLARGSLKKLVEGGRLRLVGERRASRYVSGG